MPSAELSFRCEKTPVTGTRGMVVANAPLASMAGAEMLARGGNAVDAAVASLLTLTVVEPMMVGIAGGGLCHLRLPNGEHVIFDGLAHAGAEMGSDLYTPDSNAPAATFAVEGRKNAVGPSSVAVPGNLAAWHSMHARFGRLPWADLVEPAIRAAEHGFVVSPYLHTAILETEADIADDPTLAAMLLPGGKPLAPGSHLVMPDYAKSLRLIRAQGAQALHDGPLGAALVESMRHVDRPGRLSLEDLSAYRVVERDALVGEYRGHRIWGPPPPASSGIHIVQMLNMLEHFDIKSLGFGTQAAAELLADVMRIAFEDRRAASGDPDFVTIPVEQYMSKAYAQACLARLQGAAAPRAAARPLYESQNTTHVTIADADGMIVTATHTINGLFGACYMVPGTGIIPNNYMQNFDPRPGHAMSIAPGKRVPTSMAPIVIEKGGVPVVALGLPGGTRIFTSAMQAVLNLVDHGMDLQSAIEAPRVWTDGGPILLIEKGHARDEARLGEMGYQVVETSCVGGGMNGIVFAEGMMTGAACWRADGMPVALGGGLARADIQFKI